MKVHKSDLLSSLINLCSLLLNNLNTYLALKVRLIFFENHDTLVEEPEERKPFNMHMICISLYQ